jgi:hypothetical protein
MPRHGMLWRWSDNELDLAVLTLFDRHPDTDDFTFTSDEIYVVADAITGLNAHGMALRGALLREHRIEVVDRTNPRKYVYKIRVPDGEQAQRSTPAAD